MSPGPTVAATASMPSGPSAVEAAPAAVEAAPGEGVCDHRQGELHMGAPGELGHDAPVAGVQVHLARDDRGDDPCAPPRRRPPPSRHRRSRCRGRGP